MTDIDTSEYRARLLEERERLVQAVDFLERENSGSITDELGDIVTSGGTTTRRLRGRDVRT